MNQPGTACRGNNIDQIRFCLYTNSLVTEEQRDFQEELWCLMIPFSFNPFWSFHSCSISKQNIHQDLACPRIVVSPLTERPRLSGSPSVASWSATNLCHHLQKRETVNPLLWLIFEGKSTPCFDADQWNLKQTLILSISFSDQWCARTWTAFHKQQPFYLHQTMAGLLSLHPCPSSPETSLPPVTR